MYPGGYFLLKISERFSNLFITINVLFKRTSFLLFEFFFGTIRRHGKIVLFSIRVIYYWTIQFCENSFGQSEVQSTFLFLVSISMPTTRLALSHTSFFLSLCHECALYLLLAKHAKLLRPSRMETMHAEDCR